MKLRYLKLIFLFAALISPYGARAASTEAVANFDQQAVLDRAGILTISQTINYDFGPVAPHEIVYAIPLTYHDDQGREFRVNFALRDFMIDGTATSIKPKVTADSARLTLPAGSGTTVRKYAISYTLSPVVLRGQDADILKVNITGLNWAVPIQHASLRLQTPTAPADNLTCYTGAAGSTTGRCSVDQQGSVATVTSFAPLQPGEGLGVYANFLPKSFSTYLSPYEAHPSSPLRKVAEFIGLVVLLSLIISILATRRRRRYTNANEAPEGQVNRQ